MDADRFDGLVKTLAASGSRRGALAALLGGTLGLLGLGETEAGNRDKRRQRERKRREQDRKHRHSGCRGGSAAASEGNGKSRRQDASIQGPCGNGGPKANACTRHGQCCTGYCHQKRRCRCKKLGRSCTEDRNCCANFGQPMTCQNGTCQSSAPGPVPPSPPSPPSPPPPGCTCPPDFFCNAALECLPKQTNGTPCSTGGQCLSGNCANGVCCNSACLAACQACNISGSVGTCATSPSGTSCFCGGTCDDSGNCENTDFDSTGCCGDGLRCFEGACVAAYATIPDCGGRCSNPGQPGDSSPMGPTTCTSSGFALCSTCGGDADGCVAETSCDFGDFQFIAAGPHGPGYYCVCSLDSSPGAEDGTCPVLVDPICFGNTCICDDP
jgi:hypothetical protein